MTWTVYLTRKAYKQLKRLPPVVQNLVDLATADLEEQGTQPQGWDTLKTGACEFRLRLNYRYRLRYRISGRQELEIEFFIWVTGVMHIDKNRNHQYRR